MKNYVDYLCEDCDGDPWECAKVDNCVKHDCAASDWDCFFKCKRCGEVKLEQEKCVSHYDHSANICTDCCEDCKHDSGHFDNIDNEIREQKSRDIFGY